MSCTERFKKIGEVATLLGTTPRTLRFYEEEGLIVSRRTANGTRLYSVEDIIRFKVILQLANLGLSIAEIKKLATVRANSATGQEASQKVLTILEDYLKNINEMKKKYEVLEADIKQTASIVQQCQQCSNVPNRQSCPTCPINYQLESCQMLHLIWEQNLD